MSSVKGDTPELATYYDKISDYQYGLGLSLIDMMNVNPGDSVLDIGCGTGRLALQVSGIVGLSGSVAGIDPSPHRIEIANARMNGLQNVSLKIGQGENLSDFGESTFDHAYYCAVFHWIEDKKSALHEAYRVLKPGGQVGITSRTRGSTFSVKHIVDNILEKFPEETRTMKQNNAGMWATRKEIEMLLTEAGFEDINMKSMTMTRHFQSPKDYFMFLRASSFGQPSRVPERLRSEVRDAIIEELEKRRTASGIELESNPLLITASKKCSK
jgi:arsenite methyltransferase